MNNLTSTDLALRRKLREFPVAPGLYTRLLAGRPAAAPVVWRLPALWGAVAALVLVTISLTWWLPRRDFRQFRADMLRYVSRDYRVEVAALSFADLQQKFSQAGWPAEYHISADLQTTAVEGGCLLTWRGHKISQLCLEENGRDVWLFIAAAGTFPPLTLPLPSDPAGFVTRAWQEAGVTYLLIRPR